MTHMPFSKQIKLINPLPSWHFHLLNFSAMCHILSIFTNKYLQNAQKCKFFFKVKLFFLYHYTFREKTDIVSWNSHHLNISWNFYQYNLIPILLSKSDVVYMKTLSIIPNFKVSTKIQVYNRGCLQFWY